MDFPATLAIEKRRKQHRLPTWCPPGSAGVRCGQTAGITEGIWERHREFHHWNWSNRKDHWDHWIIGSLDHWDLIIGIIGIIGIWQQKKGKKARKVGFGTPDFEKKMKVKVTRWDLLWSTSKMRVRSKLYFCQQQGFDPPSNPNICATEAWSKWRPGLDFTMRSHGAIFRPWRTHK